MRATPSGATGKVARRSPASCMRTRTSRRKRGTWWMNRACRKCKRRRKRSSESNFQRRRTETNYQYVMKHFAPLFAIVVSFGALCSQLAAAEPQKKPNIVFILIDDLGWADVAFHGGNAPTPNLNRLARENLELTRHYV